MAPPNLLFLITDQQRADTIEADSPCHMPTVQELAKRGMQFSRCYAANPICSPSRASLMTGLLPHNHGMVDCTHTVEPYRASLKPDVPFWSQHLQRAGYRTGYYGKWHIERSLALENFGFDTYELVHHFVPDNPNGFRLVAHDNFVQYQRENRYQPPKENLQKAIQVEQPGYRDMLLCGFSAEPLEATSEYYTYAKGVDFIRQADDRPWALVLSTTGPHDPYVVPQTVFDAFAPADLSPPVSFEDDLRDRPAIYRRLQRVWHDLSWDDFKFAAQCYYAFCSMIDDQVRRVVTALEETGQLDNTLIIFTSDHGDFLGAHRLFTKGIPPFEEAYRVPLVLCGPGVPPDKVHHTPVSLIDLAAAIPEMLIEEAFPCDGQSLTPLIHGEDRETLVYAEMHGQRFAYTQRVLWQNHLKYVFNAFDEDELYDLSQDPHEIQNLIHHPGYQDRLKQLAARMWKITRETGDFNLYNAQDATYRYAPIGPEGIER